MTYQSVLALVEPLDTTLWYLLSARNYTRRVATIEEFVRFPSPFYRGSQPMRDIDSLIARHVGFLLKAVEDEFVLPHMQNVESGHEEHWVWRPHALEKGDEILYDANNACVNKAEEIWGNFDENAPVELLLTTSRSLLMEQMVKRWANCADEDEAEQRIEFVGNAFLNQRRNDHGKLIMVALRKFGAGATIERRLRAQKALGKRTNWWDVDEDNPFLYVAMGCTKKMASDEPTRIVRQATFELILGPDFSEAGTEYLLENARAVAQIDETARSLQAELKGRWTVGTPDLDRMVAQLVLEMPVTMSEGDRQLALLSAATKAKKWTNPHHAEIELDLILKCNGVTDATEHVFGIADNVTVS